MGMFLGLSGIIGKTQEEVIDSLARYLSRVGGGLGAAVLDANHPDCCIIEEASGNTTVVYPGSYLKWDESSAFISDDLKAPVFSLHIHDGDLWMYVLYVDGQLVDQFNPIPDYWDEGISQEERESWKGNAETVVKYIPGLNPHDISKYLVSWQLEDEESVKAYQNDEYPQEDWQLLDFMRKLKLPYPLDDNFNATGNTYRLWTKPLKVQTPTATKVSTETMTAKETKTPTAIVDVASARQKAWWKFW